MAEQELAPRSVRIHPTSPGPRAGVPFSLSLETVNVGGMTEQEMQAEVDAAMRLYDLAKSEMEKREGG